METNDILEFSDGESSFTDSDTLIHIIDFPALARDSMEFSFSICGIALITSLGIAVVIKILKSSF